VDSAGLGPSADYWQSSFGGSGGGFIKGEILISTMIINIDNAEITSIIIGNRHHAKTRLAIQMTLIILQSGCLRGRVHLPAFRIPDTMRPLVTVKQGSEPLYLLLCCWHAYTFILWAKSFGSRWLSAG
jgi:hypothetical protein